MTLDTGLIHLPRRSLSDIESIAFVGENASLVAESFGLAGGPPLVLEADHFAYCTRGETRPGASRLRELPDDSVDLVILRRAWRAVDEVGKAVRAAHRVLVPSGQVIAADLDVNRLLAGPSPMYPVRLLYLAEPVAAERVRSSTATPATLGAEAVRAGYSPIDGLTYDDVRGSYAAVADLWAGMRERGWRGAAWIPAERRRDVFTASAGSLRGALPSGPAVDREPWYAVVGTKR